MNRFLSFKDNINCPFCGNKMQIVVFSNIKCFCEKQLFVSYLPGNDKLYHIDFRNSKYRVIIDLINKITIISDLDYLSGKSYEINNIIYFYFDEDINAQIGAILAFQ